MKIGDSETAYLTLIHLYKAIDACILDDNHVIVFMPLLERYTIPDGDMAILVEMGWIELKDEDSDEVSFHLTAKGRYWAEKLCRKHRKDFTWL